MYFDSLRARIARRLEAGTGAEGGTAAGLWLRTASAMWSRLAAARVCRPFVPPRGVRTIGIGGALLGGSGKTPVAIALARGLGTRGEKVALIGHGYRAHPERAHIVRPGDPLASAGDDALCAARLLAPDDIAVIVGPTRQAAADCAAASGFTTLILDGLLQATPRRLDAAILVLDAAAPWGSGACPPLGDLRAPAEALLAAADHVAAIVEEGAGSRNEDAIHSAALPVASSLRGAIDANGNRMSLADLTQCPSGLLVAIARPHRVMRMLARHGIHPAPVIALADHATLDGRTRDRARKAPVDFWLTTARCAAKWPSELNGRPVMWLDHVLNASELIEWVRSRALPPPLRVVAPAKASGARSPAPASSSGKSG